MMQTGKSLTMGVTVPIVAALALKAAIDFETAFTGGGRKNR